MDELLLRAKKAAHRFGIPSLAEDFSQEAGLAFHLGKLTADASLYRFWVDFLRTQYGRQDGAYAGLIRAEKIGWLDISALLHSESAHALVEPSAPGEILWEQLLACLEPRSRTIISMHYEWGYELQEVAALLNLHPSRIAQLHTIAKAKLLKCLTMDTVRRPRQVCTS